MRPDPSRSPEKRGHRNSAHRNVALLVMLGLVLGLLILTALMIAGLRQQIADLEKQMDACKAGQLRLPVRFITAEPDCTNRLMEQMGIQNVRVISELPANASPVASNQP